MDDMLFQYCHSGSSMYYPCDVLSMANNCHVDGVTSCIVLAIIHTHYVIPIAGGMENIVITHFTFLYQLIHKVIQELFDVLYMGRCWLKVDMKKFWVKHEGFAIKKACHYSLQENTLGLCLTNEILYSQVDM